MEQLSFLSGVELLRMHEFRREAIRAHRHTTNNPLYWTNADVCLWLKRINMEVLYIQYTSIHSLIHSSIYLLIHYPCINALLHVLIPLLYVLILLLHVLIHYFMY